MFDFTKMSLLITNAVRKKFENKTKTKQNKNKNKQKTNKQKQTKKPSENETHKTPDSP